jgi:hypothetical protein
VIERDRVSADDVIAYAKANGERVTKEQLARWHRAGLIPQPETRHRTGQRGTESTYPPSTAVQAVAASQVLARERNLGRAAFRLWWEGYPIGVAAARDLAEKLARDLDHRTREFADLIGSSGKLTRKGEERIADLSAAPPAIRHVHRRVAERGNEPKAFAELITAIGRLVVRGDSTTPAEDAALIEHGLGLDEGRKLPIAQGKPWLEGPPGAGLEDLQGAFAPGRFTELVGQASDEALTNSRDTAQALIASLLGFADVLRMIDPPWGAGLGLLADFLDRWTGRAEGICTVLLIVLAFSEREELRRGMDELREPLERWSSTGLRSWQQLAMLCSEVPEIRRILTPARLRRALRTQAEYGRLLDDLRKAYKQYGRKIDAAVAANPDLFPPDDFPPGSNR